MMRLAVLLGSLATTTRAQGDACNIANLFSHLQTLTSSPECCPVGSCASGFPGSDDGCTTECGIVFEPFWDEVRPHRVAVLVAWGGGGAGRPRLRCPFGGVSICFV
jgi:hypothetical protein